MKNIKEMIINKIFKNKKSNIFLSILLIFISVAFGSIFIDANIAEAEPKTSSESYGSTIASNSNTGGRSTEDAALGASDVGHSVKTSSGGSAGTSMVSKIYTGLGWIIYGIAWTIGQLTSFLIGWLIQVASFNKFISVPAVTEGWEIIRNLANMFFILILLLIAFATILRVEQYNIKKLLPKVIIMAVLINFSKTICAIIIEISQVIMMTFVNTFTTNGTANLISLLGIRQMWETALGGKNDEMSLVAVGGLVIGLIATIIALVVIVTAIAMLVMRVIMLWIYIVLSPLAYLMAAFPEGQKYSSQWWGDFTKNVITGPVLAFFMWLAFSTAQTSSQGISDASVIKSVGMTSGVISNFLSEGVFQTYIITIGFLVGGLVVTQQIGGVAASVAGKGINAIQKGRSMAYRGAMGTGSYIGRKIAANTGVELRPTKIYEGIKESFKQAKERDDGQARSKAGEMFEAGGWRSMVGALGAGADGANAFLSGPLASKGIMNAAKTFWNGPGKIKKKMEEHKTDVGIIENDKKKLENDKKILENNIKNLKTEPYSDDRNDAITAKEAQLKIKNDEIRTKDNELKKLETDHRTYMAKITPPTAFEGRTAERALINAEKKKAAEFNTSDELVLNFKKAMADGNTHRAIAIAEQLADDGDANELLTAHGYETSAIGLHQFVQNELKGKNGISERDALRYQDYISTGAQKAGQWELAKTTKVNVDGSIESLIKVDKNGNYDDREHVDAAYGDMSKMDPQDLARVGRLGLGGEDLEGNYQLSNLGKRVMANMGNAFFDHNKRVKSNTAKSILSSKAFQENYKVILSGYTDKVQEDIKKALTERSATTPENFDEQYKRLKTL